MTWEEWLRVKDKYPVDKLKPRQIGNSKATATIAVYHTCKTKEEFDSANKLLKEMWNNYRV